MSYALINKMTVKAGKRQEVVDILSESGEAFGDNPDCLLSLVSLDDHDDNVIWVQDVWTSEQSHAAAMQDETMRTYIQKAVPLLEKMPEQTEISPVGGKFEPLF